NIVVRSHQGAVVLNALGKKIRAIPLGPEMQFLAVARSPAGPRIIGWDVWSMSVEARDTTGKQIWRYASADAADWVVPVDLALPQGDAVAVGYNGDGGVRVVNPDGTMRWRAKGQGNTWSVGAARLSKQGPDSVICVGDNSVLVFDSLGKQTQ